jgi:hypothetical protein
MMVSLVGNERPISAVACPDSIDLAKEGDDIPGELEAAGIKTYA